MKVKSSLVLILAALFVLGCATAGPKSILLISDSQLISEIEFNWEGSEDAFVPAVAIADQKPDSEMPPDYFAVLSRFNEVSFSTAETLAGGDNALRGPISSRELGIDRWESIPYHYGYGKEEVH
jgi:hypothetical protein